MVLAVDIGNSNICIGGLAGEAHRDILFTTRMVTGSIITSYMDFSTIWVHIISSNSCHAIMPPNATGKNISESAVSPTTVDQMARAEK